jgi:hypothetical protein
MANITQRKADGFYLAEIIMELNPMVSGIQTLRFFKKLETFIRKRFMGVRDFYCVKDIQNNYVKMTFTHLGYIMEVNDAEFKLLESELKQIKY